jgi:formyl-CoA transferase
VPVSPIKNLVDVVQDPLVENKLLFAQDPITSQRITLAPPPISTPFIEENNGELSFPPRFGEHNALYYGEKLGYDRETLDDFKAKGVI